MSVTRNKLWTLSSKCRSVQPILSCARLRSGGSEHCTGRPRRSAKCPTWLRQAFQGN